MKELMLEDFFAAKLGRLKNPPGKVHWRGCVPYSFKDAPFVAIVGSRKVTPYGKTVTRKFAEALAKEGVVIVSGLAIGVDALAHQACVAVGGRAIAVLPSGLDSIYPASNQPLAKKITEMRGLLLTEYESHHKPRKVEFLERNRVIAALSDLVLIPEAAAHSGSLNTAHHAMTMQIPIAAVPGNIDSPMSEGTNHLLQQGAHAVTKVEDVLQLIGIKKKSKKQSLNLTGTTDIETLVLQKLAKGVRDSQTLQTMTKLSTTELQTTIGMLEVEGRVKIDEIGNIRLQ